LVENTVSHQTPRSIGAVSLGCEQFTIPQNALTREYRGKFGQDFILRIRNGVSIMYKLHDYRNKVWTEPQQINRIYFAKAVNWALTALRDERTYRYYKMRRRGAQTVVNVAVGDYIKFRAFVLDMNDYSVGKGGKIKFKMKHQLGNATTLVTLLGFNKKEIEKGAGKITDDGKEVDYRVSNHNNEERPQSVSVTIFFGAAELTSTFNIPNEFQ